MLKEKIEDCRLCGKKTDSIFNLKILSKYIVEYRKCTYCDSIQTQNPYWLDEVYATNNLSHLDTGAVQRNLKNLAVTYLLSKLLNVEKILDVGGGDGLLCRLLRDYEVDCYINDKYATPTYAQSFLTQSFEKTEMYLAFEVLEHFSNPEHEIDKLFNHRPNAILVSTELYRNQRKSWWYFSPESGQHLFFYSKKAFEYIAQKYNYNVTFFGKYILLSKKDYICSLVRSILPIILNKYTIPFIRIFIVLLPTHGVIKDRDRLIKE